MTESLSAAPPIIRMEAHVVDYGGYKFILRGEGSQRILSSDIRSFGPVVFVRCGVILSNGNTNLFPSHAFGDYGAEYIGADALDWILRSGFKFPRADVIGWEEHGKASSVMLREIDIGLGASIFVSNSESEFPGIRVSASVHLEMDVDSSAGVLCRAEEYIPVLRIGGNGESDMDIKTIAREIKVAVG